MEPTEPMERSDGVWKRAAQRATDSIESVETVEIVETPETDDILRRLWQAPVGNPDSWDTSPRESPRMGVDTPLRPAH